MRNAIEKHDSWSSRVSFLMACMGTAVGLGNIWKFPYTAGSGGGSAFVIVYLLSIVLVATPIMIAEMVMGRHGRMSAPSTLARLAAESRTTPKWKWLGWLGLVTVFLVLSFFSVVAGWSMAYVVKTASGVFTGLGAAEAGVVFDAFLHRPTEVVSWHLLFMVATILIVSAGINSGIEKAVNILMPGLAILLVGLVIYALVEGDAARTMEFLFVPDFSKLTGPVALSAIGQAFFSVNVGIGMVLTYSAYLPATVDIPRSAVIIALGDTVVALLAGLAIFPIVFATGLDPAGGPGLLFVTMSAAFGSMPGGAFFGAAFFLFVFVAALTSSIGMLELMVARAEESKYLKRRQAAPLLGIGAFLFGLITVFSFSIWDDVRMSDALPGIGGLSPFDSLDYVVTNFLLPVGGMLYALFAGWYLSREACVKELDLSPTGLAVWRFLVRFVAPGAVALVFISQLT